MGKMQTMEKSETSEMNKENDFFINLNQLKKQEKQDFLEAINQSENNFLDQVDAGIYVKNLSNEYIFVNQYLVKNIFCLSAKSEVLGQKDSIKLWKKNASKFDFLDQEFLNNPKSTTQEEWRYLNNGEKRLYWTFRQPLYNKNQQLIGILTQLFDLTKHEKMLNHRLKELKKHEENKLKLITGTVFGGISHDINTPVHSNGLVLSMIEAQLSRLKVEGENAKILQNISEKLTFIHSNNEKIGKYVDIATRMMRQIVYNQEELKLNDYFLEDLLLNILRKETNINMSLKDTKTQIIIDENAFSYIINVILANAKVQIEHKKRGKINISSQLNSEGLFIDFVDTSGGVDLTEVKEINKLFTTKETQADRGTSLQFAQLLMASMDGNLSVHLVENDCLMVRLCFRKIKF